MDNKNPTQELLSAASKHPIALGLAVVVLAPSFFPLLIVLLPIIVLGLAALWVLTKAGTPVALTHYEAETQMNDLPCQASRGPDSQPLPLQEAVSPAVSPAPPEVKADGSAPSKLQQPPAAPSAAAPEPAAVKPAPAAAALPPVLTGSAAILARMRADKEKSTKTAADKKAAEKASGEAAEKKADVAAEAAPGAQPAAREVVVAYASQLGTAQEIARTIQAEAVKQGVPAKVLSLNELGFENVTAAATPVLVVVASSTGDGDTPDNGAKFVATMKRKTQPEGLLAGVRYTVLGLGDSNYTRFMATSRSLKSRLAQLGAEPFYGHAEADEVDGIESVVDPWVEGLWPALAAALAGLPTAEQEAASTDAPAAAAPVAKAPAAIAPAPSDAPADEQLVGVPALPACRIRLEWEANPATAAAVAAAEAGRPGEADAAWRDPEGMYSSEQPFWARVAAARYLTASQSDRSVLHVELDVSGSGMALRPGDALAVLPQNDPHLVDGLLTRLGADGAAVLRVEPLVPGGPALLRHLGWPCTLRHALTWGCDLTSTPRKSLLRLLAEHCSDPAEQHRLLLLSSRGGRDAYASEVRDGRPSLLDLLRGAPSCRPPLPELLDALPPLAPRLYSLSSSPLEHPEQAHVAFSVVSYESAHGPKRGVATGWLDRLLRPLSASSPPTEAASSANGSPPPEVRLAVYLRRGGDFRPPEKLVTPLVMIGPGTGVTPFRGFLQDRRQRLRQRGGSENGGVGEAWLFFGCRDNADYLYRQDLEAFETDGTLTRLCVARSRAQTHKVYVQDLMREHGQQLVMLIRKQGAHVYVCGDGAAMAKDVHACLAGLLSWHAGLSEAQAAEELTAMTKAHRYVRDIWS